MRRLSGRCCLGWLSILALSVIAAACRHSAPKLDISSTEALVDERMTITVAGLEPFSAFSVRATTLDQKKRQWIAEAKYGSDKDGLADLSRTGPYHGGPYEGPDAMGLFWSATPDTEGAQIAHRVGIDYTTTLELLVGGAVVDEKTVTRRFDASGLERLAVAEQGVVGMYFKPPGGGPFPGVVVFAGSDGGLASAEWRAALLASRGFAALAVAVFRYDGRPSDLVEIPLEDGLAAISWLVARQETARIGLLGFSKGSELALSLASRDARAEAVVAISPTAFVWPGVSDGPPEMRSSWTWRGDPLPPIPWSVGPEAGTMFAAGPPFRLRSLYEESLDAADSAVLAAATIPVLDIRGPILLVSGDDDGSWPAAEMAARIVEQFEEAGRGESVEHLRYPDAGHLLFWDLLPATSSERNRGQVFGGSPAANARARADSWPRIQTFLADALGDD